MELREGGLDHPAVAALIDYHIATARSHLPPGFAHAVGAEALARPEVTFVSAWDGDDLLGIAALRQMEPGHAELKSMRTHPERLRRGAGRALLAHLIDTARAHGCTRVSLETGRGPRFDPANALYEAFGFVDVPAFGSYPPSPHNRFMSLAL
jgi:putative acetyltransferase